MPKFFQKCMFQKWISPSPPPGKGAFSEIELSEIMTTRFRDEWAELERRTAHARGDLMNGTGDTARAQISFFFPAPKVILVI